MVDFLETSCLKECHLDEAPRLDNCSMSGKDGLESWIALAATKVGRLASITSFEALWAGNNEYLFKEDFEWAELIDPLALGSEAF